MNLRVFDFKDNVTTLGPGVRFVIWTQGCPRSCIGCMTPNSQVLDGGHLVDVDSLVEKIKRSQRTELTISGGEPFIQAEALVELIKKLRSVIDLGVIIYTGYTYEEIRSNSNSSYKELLELCDLIVDGAYKESLNDGKSFRGSLNQQAILLTQRYKDFLKDFGTKPSKVEFFIQENKICMVGIPSREILEKFRNETF